MIQSRLLYLASLAMAVLITLFYENTAVSFLLLYGLLLLLLAALVTVLAAPFLLRVEEEAGLGEVFGGEELLYTLHIKNRGFFYYSRVMCVYRSSKLVRYGEEDAVDSLGPRGSIRKQRSVRFPYRGVYELGVAKVRVTDFLGLLRITIPVKLPLVVTVLPRADEDFALPIKNDPEKASMRQHLHNEDYTEIADVRKYAPSDSLRRIHWKLTAKRGELMVKNYPTNVPDKTVVFLDTRRLPLDGEARAAFEDAMASAAASAVSFCARKNLAVDLYYGEAGENFRVESGDDLAGAFRRLAQLDFAGESSGFQPCCDSIDLDFATVNLAAFLSGIDRDSYDLIRGFLSFDHNVYLYCFCASELSMRVEEEEYLEGLRSYGVYVSKIRVEEA